MRRKNFMLTVAAAAVMSTFNPAFGGQNDWTVNANPNVGVDANVGTSNTDVNAGANISPGVSVGSGDQSVSSGVTANQSSTDIGSSSAMDESTTTGQASGSASGETHHGKARGHGEDKLTGLERADQVAGEHGQHGRDNARERQGSQ